MNSTHWTKAYNLRINSVYPKKFQKNYRFWLEILKNHVENTRPEWFCLLGSGIATEWIALSHLISPKILPKQLFLVDSSKKMLLLAEKNLQFHNCLPDLLITAQLNIVSSKTHPLQALLTSSKAGFFCSMGVLEHFSDRQLQFFAKNWLNTPNHHNHWVPGPGYGSPSHGDERLLSPQHWEHLLPLKTTTCPEEKSIILS